MTYVYWDIETEPLPPEAVNPFRPEFTAPSNYKDPVKIESYVTDKSAEWEEKLALDGKTARIICAGVAIDSDAAVIVEGEEGTILRSLLDLFDNAIERGAAIIGFNSERFDWPFFRHRCLLRGMGFPMKFLSPWKGRYYWRENLKDVYTLWTLGQTIGSVSNSLDNVAKAFGLDGKTGDGADFAALYRTDPEAARAYLLHDVELTRALWQRLSI